MKLKHSEVTDKIIKAFYEVYNELGSGFLESVYESAMEIVLKDFGLIVERQRGLPVFFRGQNLSLFRADLVVNHKVILELKAVKSLAPEHEAQLLNYLKATDIEVGLLINFGPKPSFKRFVFGNSRKKIRVEPRGSAVS
ncbi:MAG: GxxExxY protein [Candidatus Marinimicrobia bacterium]|nr:GxxExxY protein [Candidatus Neomarinimicrobiota bacterium]